MLLLRSAPGVVRDANSLHALVSMHAGMDVVGLSPPASTLPTPPPPCEQSTALLAPPVVARTVDFRTASAEEMVDISLAYTNTCDREGACVVCSTARGSAVPLLVCRLLHCSWGGGLARVTDLSSAAAMWGHCAKPFRRVLGCGVGV
jgi:hypothetical protein